MILKRDFLKYIDSQIITPSVSRDYLINSRCLAFFSLFLAFHLPVPLAGVPMLLNFKI